MEILNELDTPYPISQEQIDFYKKYNFIKLKNVISKETIAYFNTVISDSVISMNKNPLPIEQRNTYGKAL